MIVSLPFSYTAEAIPVRGRKVREVTFTEKVTVDVPEIADAEPVATVSGTGGRVSVGTVRHDGRSLVRPMRLGGQNAAPMTRELLTTLLRNRYPGAWKFKDYPLPLVRSEDGTGWNFADPVDPPGFEICDPSVRERASADAARAARSLVFFGDALHVRCPDPRMVLDVCQDGDVRSSVTFALPSREDANSFAIPLADFMDDRFEAWFAPRQHVGFEVEIHRPDLLTRFDPLKANAERIAAGILSAFGAVSGWTRSKEEFEILSEAFALSKAIFAIPEGAAASEAFDRFDALPDGIRETAYPVRRMIRYLRESGWVERSPTQTRAIDLEALGANLI